MNKIKVLLISNMYPSKKGEFYGIFVKNFIIGFENTKIEIIAKTLILGRGRSAFQKIKKYILFYFSIIKNIFKFNYDIIYIHYPIYASLPIILCSPFIIKPIVLNFHGTDVFAINNFSKFLQLITKPLIKKSNTIIVPSTYFKKVVVNKFNIGMDKVFVSPSGGINTDVFKDLETQSDKAFFTLGYVGRIDEGKGWDVLLKAFSILLKKIPNLKCIIAGNGSQVNDLNNLINQLNITSNVSVIGSIPHADLHIFYNKLDLFIFPTTRIAESLGLVGVEALSCGVPIVGSRIGGLEDYIIEGVNGSLFKTNNHQDLAAKIFHLYNHKSILRNLKKEARNSVKNYDMKYVSNRLTNKLEEIVQQNAKI